MSTRAYRLITLLSLLLAAVSLTTRPIAATTECTYPCQCICPSPTATATPMPAPTLTPTATPVPSPSGATLRICHITDLHAGAFNNNPSAIVAMLRGMPSRCDIAVDTGDCTDNGLAYEWSMWRSWWANATIPWRYLPGNHDRTFTGARNWTWEVDGVLLVGLDWNAPDVAMAQAAIATGKPVVVFVHTPISGTRGASTSGVGQLDMLAWVCGHTHIGAISRVGDTLQIITGRSGLGVMRVITVTAGALIY